MKILLIFNFLCLILQVFCEDNPVDALLEAYQECNEKFGVDETFRLNALLDNSKIKEDNLQINEYFACTYSKAGLLNNDGNINVIQLKKLVEESFSTEETLIDKGIEACKDVKGNDSGDTVVKNYNCLVEHGAIP